MSLSLCLGLVLAGVPARADHPEGVRPLDIQLLQDDLANLQDTLAAVPTSHPRYRDFEQRAETIRASTERLRVQMERHQRDNRTGLGATVEDVRVLRSQIDRLEGDVELALDRRYTGGRAMIDQGTALEVRLETPLSSATARPEDRVRATLARPVLEDGRVAIRSGARLEGVVTSAEKADRPARGGKLELSFDRLILADGTSLDLRTRIVEIKEDTGNRETAQRAGLGAALGGILGAVIGGRKGAVVGVLAGGSGGAISSKGDEVELPAGTVLTLELQRPLDVRSSSLR
jgi:hypothetical protein